MSIVKYDHSLHTRKHLTSDDECFYFIEATNGGFRESDSNNLLFNYKRLITSSTNTQALYYRNKAIEKFVDYLSTIDEFSNDNLIVIPASTSKKRGSPLFNDRIDKTVELLQQRCPNLIIEKAFDTIEDVTPSHNGGQRDIESVIANIEWKGFKHEPSEKVFIIDDTLTTGSHFKSWKTIINHYYPDIEVVGIFLALYTRKTQVEEINLPDFIF
ncbi:hypothetical protein ACN9JZ_03415 [Aliarcobacter butzleri]|uniref:hypothetical protein n=1 Tax=Aliarcobacter butzleri TaxID=28197 RepID=UPI003AF7D5EB